MLLMANRFGVVEASIPALARRANVSQPECESALRIFLSPDEHSRSKDFEGRRIQQADGGWHLLNHEKYSRKASACNKRVSAAARQRRKYERDKATNQDKSGLVR
jgi:hypothetical protein